MEELHGQVGDDLLVVAQMKTRIVATLPYDGHLHGIAFADLAKAQLVLRRHRQHHPLLRLRQPDLPGLKPMILERHPVQLHGHPDLLAHLAHGRGESSRAAIGDGRV